LSTLELKPIVRKQFAENTFLVYPKSSRNSTARLTGHAHKIPW